MVSSVRFLCPLVFGCLRVVLSRQVILSTCLIVYELVILGVRSSVLGMGKKVSLALPCVGIFFIIWVWSSVLVDGETVSLVLPYVGKCFGSQAHAIGSLSPSYTWSILSTIISGSRIPMLA